MLLTETVPQLASRFELIDSPCGDTTSFAEDVATGLEADPKQLSCHWLYDAHGSELFEQICALPEYYLTRCERSILHQRAAQIAGLFGSPIRMVELGSGSATKTRLLIEAFLKEHGRLVFAPIDISRSMLERSSARLLEDYTELEVCAFAGRYETGLAHMASETREARLTLWLGSSVGNLDRRAALQFLREMRKGMRERDRLLIGIDLRKSKEVLERAYDDSAGVTARFDLNLLARINRELGGQFDLEAFAHRAAWREDPGRVESHLVSRRAQRVRVDALARDFDFREGETIHTENSYKYSPAEIDDLARDCDMRCEERWLDEDGLFSLNLFAPRS